MKKAKIETTCCFTGHRPQGLPFQTDESHPDCVKLKALLRQEIVRLITEECVTHFITGMALGVDLMAAEIVLELKREYPQITLESAIPCEEQAIKWTVEQRERYYNIAEKCDKETMLQLAYTRDCMKKRNRYMVDNSAFVLAVWDGTFRSGTGQTVRYARELCKKVTVINPKTLALTRENQLNTAQE